MLLSLRLSLRQCFFVGLLARLCQHCACSSSPRLCNSRQECNSTEVCLHDEVTVWYGRCDRCDVLKVEYCKPPCFRIGTRCTNDNYSFALDLDMQPPFYLAAFGALTKATVQFLIFPPTKLAPTSVIASTALLGTQCCFLVIAIFIFFEDICKISEVAIYPKLTIVQRLLSVFGVVAVSTNVPTALAVFFQDLVFYQDIEHATRSEKAKRASKLFWAYLNFLRLTYGMAIVVLSALAAPGVFMYCWVSLPCMMSAFILGKPLSKFVISDLNRHHSNSVAAELSQPLRQSIEPLENQRITAFFWILLLAPLLQFILVTEMRYFDGYGYWESLYLTLAERHLSAYSETLKLSLVNQLKLVWLFL